MRVVVPFTDLQPETAVALDATGYEWEAVDVSDSDEAYWSLLAGLWSDGETFTIVEHDVVVVQNAMRQFEECYGEWCAFPAQYVNGPYAGLACTKFSAALIARNPQAVVKAGELYDSTHPPRHWCRLDAWLQRQFAGERRCFHVPVLRHIRDYKGHPQPSHGCREPAPVRRSPRKIT